VLHVYRTPEFREENGIREKTFLLMTQCSSITAKLGKYSVFKDMIHSTFKKIEFERLGNSFCFDAEETDIIEKPKITSDEEMIEAKRYESLSLRPKYQDDSKKTKVDTSSTRIGYTHVDYQYRLM
jgi:hypothetical protein